MGYFVIAAFMGGHPIWTQPPQIQPRLAAPPAVVMLRPKLTLKPGQACAIPLLNVLRRDWGHDDMVKRIPGPAQTPAGVVRPPAPSCDDVK